MCLAMVFATLLYIQLQREIGMNSSKEKGSTVFGIRDKKFELKGECILPFLLDSLTTWMRSYPNNS